MPAPKTRRRISAFVAWAQRPAAPREGTTVKRLIRQPPEQTGFVVILAGQGRRYRNVILASDLEDAHEKAAQIAATLTGNFAVQAVRRAEARAADAARGRGSARAA
jgi:hypothetical protein